MPPPMPADPRPAILQVLPALRAGGVERGTIEIAAAQAEAGFRPLVASAGGAMVAELEAVGARHFTLPLDRKSPSALLGGASALAEIVKTEGVRILHARSRFPAWSALMAARRTGAHFMTTYHGTYNEGFPGKRLYNSVMARGERVIAISQHIANIIRERHGTDATRIRVIPRGVDIGRFDPAAVPEARIEALRAAWGVPKDRPVLILPGRVTRWKGQGVLLQAVAALPQPRPFVILVGDEGRGTYAEELRGQIATLGLQGDVAMPGHCDDLPTALLLADIALHCSTDAEGFGRTIIEAQAMERPVIASDLGAPRETVLEGETGWRVPPGDVPALAACLARVLAMHAQERARIGAQSRAMVLEHYTKRAMQQATMSVYRELL
jgi:glycosyltransferase involved in cell wall biosynthesis